ncbi:MAG: hypothetical protein AABZ60_06250 [Planctomycetota bacterium]
MNDESTPEEFLEPEDDFSHECQQCGRSDPKSRFCPYCGHDKVEDDTFSDQQIELQESKKRDQLKAERLGRCFFLLLVIPLLHWGKLYFLPYSEFLFFAILAYLGVLLHFTEPDFRFFLLKRPSLKWIGIACAGGLMLGCLQRLLFPVAEILLPQCSFWSLIYWVGTMGILYPLCFFGVFLSTVEKLMTSLPKARLCSSLGYAFSSYTYSWKLVPFYLLVGWGLAHLKKESQSIQTLFCGMGLSGGVLVCLSLI